MMLAFSVLISVVATVLSVMIWWRAGKRPRVALVEAIRISLVISALIILWQPETLIETSRPEKRQIVLLLDGSASMQTADVRSGTAVIDRQEAVRQFLSDPNWDDLQPRFELKRNTFARQPGQATDLATALEETVKANPSAAAVLLISDGDWNSGPSPLQIAAELSTRGASSPSIYGVAVGSSSTLPDLELLNAEVPTFGVAGKPVRIPFAVRNSFETPKETKVRLQVDGITVEEQSLTLASNQRQSGTLSWRPETSGDFQVSVEIPVSEDETIDTNNRLSQSIEVRDERLRVLVIESTPRWEYRYLRNALIRDRGIDVSCLLLHPSLDQIGGGAADYLDEFPQQAAELASYDVIFLGDVGVGPKQLSGEDCERIRGLVRQQAVGLVLLPGFRGNQASLEDSPLADLIPVVLDPARPRGVGSETPGSFSLTATGRQSLLTQLTDDPAENWNVWESLPGFQWHASVVRAKAGGDVLAVHSDSSNRFGRLPLLVSRVAGAGKVLYMATDGAWRWRYGVEDKYHYRFWGQVIRWMAYQRNMAVGERMRLSFRPEQPRPGETVFFRVSVMTAEGTPLRQASLPLRIEPPTGKSETLPLRQVDSEWGVFVGQRQLQQTGVHRITISHPQDDSQLETSVVVQGRAVEAVGRPARPDVIREIAAAAKGKFLAIAGGKLSGSNTSGSNTPGNTASDDETPSLAGTLVAQLNRLPDPPAEVRRIRWWSHPLTMIGMIVGLTLFWIGRKWAGMI